MNKAQSDREEQPLSSRQRLIRLGRYVLPLVLLGAAVHLILPQIASLEHSLQVIKGMAWWAVALAIAMQLLSYLGSGYLLQALTAMTGQQLSLLRGTAIFTASVSVGLAGGGAVGSIAATYRWLRGSGAGGEGAVTAVSQFLGSGNVLLAKDAQGETTPVPAEDGGVALDMPLVLLVNKGTASAAEIVAGALQDAGRATLVGETTFGTGTVLSEFQLSDGSVLLLAVQEWLTPAGRVIWHQGIAPDVEVTLPPTAHPLLPLAEAGMTPDQLHATEDAQVLRALELLAPPEESGRSVTLADDGGTITVRAGERFLLKLGEDYDWEVAISDERILSRMVNVTVVRGAQGLYEAKQPGSTTLTATGDPVCRQSQPPCAMPSRLFKIDVTVR